jgi:hypothetical protein
MLLRVRMTFRGPGVGEHLCSKVLRDAGVGAEALVVCQTPVRSTAMTACDFTAPASSAPGDRAPITVPPAVIRAMPPTTAASLPGEA